MIDDAITEIVKGSVMLAMLGLKKLGDVKKDTPIEEKRKAYYDLASVFDMAGKNLKQAAELLEKPG